MMANLEIKRAKDFSHYTRGGKKYVGATTIINYFYPPFLVNWIQETEPEVVEKTREEALSIGHKVHEYAETPGKDEYKGRNRELGNALHAYDKWSTESDFQILGNEEPVISLRFGYAGTLDFRGDGEIGDFKTSKRISAGHWLQVAAYANAWEEMNEPKKIDWLRIVRLDKDLGIYEERRERNLPERFLVPFLGLLSAYRYYSLEA